jgi:hypothetical protein
VIARLPGRPAAERPEEPLWPDIEAALHTALDPDVEALKQLVPQLDLALWPNFTHLGVDVRAPVRAESPPTR